MAAILNFSKIAMISGKHHNFSYMGHGPLLKYAKKFRGHQMHTEPTPAVVVYGTGSKKLNSNIYNLLKT